MFNYFLHPHPRPQHSASSPEIWHIFMHNLHWPRAITHLSPRYTRELSSAFWRCTRWPRLPRYASSSSTSSTSSSSLLSSNVHPRSLWYGKYWLRTRFGLQILARQVARRMWWIFHVGVRCHGYVVVVRVGVRCHGYVVVVRVGVPAKTGRFRRLLPWLGQLQRRIRGRVWRILAWWVNG